jgi:hypothetical protein
MSTKTKVRRYVDLYTTGVSAPRTAAAMSVHLAEVYAIPTATAAETVGPKAEFEGYEVERSRQVMAVQNANMDRLLDRVERYVERTTGRRGDAMEMDDAEFDRLLAEAAAEKVAAWEKDMAEKVAEYAGRYPAMRAEYDAAETARGVQLAEALAALPLALAGTGGGNAYARCVAYLRQRASLLRLRRAGVAVPAMTHFDATHGERLFT